MISHPYSSSETTLIFHYKTIIYKKNNSANVPFIPSNSFVYCNKVPQSIFGKFGVLVYSNTKFHAESYGTVHFDQNELLNVYFAKNRRFLCGALHTSFNAIRCHVCKQTERRPIFHNNFGIILI